MKETNQKDHMYAGAKTWNPFKGCLYDCEYCKPSFQQQAKRQMHLCNKCYTYVPHTHAERLEKIPNAKIVFVCGNGDLAFCEPEYLRKIVKAVSKHANSHPYTSYYFQSKEPVCLVPFLSELPEQAILVTTLETNRDSGYEKLSKAPVPSLRYSQFCSLEYPRKVVTIEPVMAFDPDIFAEWIVSIAPEYVWFGLNSRHKQLQLPEPSVGEMKEFIHKLQLAGIQIKYKDLRGTKDL